LPAERQQVPSILNGTIRRSFFLGRVFILGGLGYVVVLSTVTELDSGPSALTAVGVFLPIFAALGAMGGLMVFTGDRVKGVYEYLIAYGFSPLRLFLNILLACLVLVTVVLAISLSFSITLHLVLGGSISAMQAELLGLYAVPMSYASASLASIVGMYWASLSSPRQALNSPIGLMPIVGLAPPLLTLVLVGVVAATYGPSAILLVTSAAVLLVTAAALLLLSQVPRRLSVERFLSPI
jgi:hypothetical protein